MNQEAKPPKVSVCVITYNHGRYVEQCLRSIVEQETDFAFEVIVSDDCSTDGTRAIVESFAQKYPHIVRPLLQPRNLGGNLNYLTVHRAATAEFTSHCDGDDFWQPGKLQVQVDFLKSHPECASVFTNANVVAEDGTHLGVFSSGVPTTFDASFLIRRGNFLNHSSMMYRTALRTRMQPDSLDFIDFNLYLRLCRDGRLGYIDQCLVSYRDQSVGSTIRTDNSTIRAYYWKALCAIDDGLATVDARRDARSHFLASATRHELVRGSLSGYRKWSDMVRLASPDDFQRVRAKAMYLALVSLSGSVMSRIRSHVKRGEPSNHVFYPR